MKSHLTVSEVAKVTKKERTTIVRWITSGKFGHVPKVGGEYQVSHDSFRKWWGENLLQGVSNNSSQ